MMNFTVSFRGDNQLLPRCLRMEVCFFDWSAAALAPFPTGRLDRALAA